MPELPEVETVRRGLLLSVLGRRIEGVNVRQPRLREPVDVDALQQTVGWRWLNIRRRAKYLLIDIAPQGSNSEAQPRAVILVHLGMTGRLQVVPAAAVARPHDHVLFHMEGGIDVRFNDARRFGLIDVIDAGCEAHHAKLRNLGIEPLEALFSGAWLHTQARKSKKPIKNFLMDGTRLVGVGNIYACEALHRARIHPSRPAQSLSRARCDRLAEAVIETLNEAIAQGGTTLRDFAGADGKAGYFAVALRVYGRADEPCTTCQRPVRRIVQAGRSTFYCTRCQT